MIEANEAMLIEAARLRYEQDNPGAIWDDVPAADRVVLKEEMRPILQGMFEKLKSQDNEHVLLARVWPRESTQEWVLEVSGTIDDTYMVCRHTQPLSIPAADVPGLPLRYEDTEETRLASNFGRLVERLKNRLPRKTVRTLMRDM